MLSNNPPDMAVTAVETMTAISDWLKERPTIDTEEAARAAKVMIDRGKLCIKDLEDERTKKVKPLNEQVKEVNDHYRSPRDNLQKVVDEISRRVGAFLREEERKRQEIAEAARKEREAACQRAADAAKAIEAAQDDADQGVLGADIGTATVDAEAAQIELERAFRREVLAERDAKVRLGGGFMRALGLRTITRLEVVEPYHALEVMGLTADIEEAIIKSAREFHRQHRQWPAGIRAIEEREA
jgi:hypothetical protein